MSFRGYVYDADLNPVAGAEQAGIRPVIIIQPYKILGQSPTVIIVPVTTDREDKYARRLPSSVILKKGDGGLTEESIALCNQIRAITKGRIGKKRGELSNDGMSKITKAVGIITGVLEP